MTAEPNTLRGLRLRNVVVPLSHLKHKRSPLSSAPLERRFRKVGSDVPHVSSSRRRCDHVSERLCVCVSRLIPYGYGTHMRRFLHVTLWDAPRPSQVRPCPIACRIHDSAEEVVVAEKHPHTRQTHKGASTPQTAACKARPTPQATQQAPATPKTTQQDSRGGREMTGWGGQG